MSIFSCGLLSERESFIGVETHRLGEPCWPAGTSNQAVSPPPPRAGTTSVHHLPALSPASPSSSLILGLWAQSASPHAAWNALYGLRISQTWNLEAPSLSVPSNLSPTALFSSFANMYTLYPRKGWTGSLYCWLAVSIEFELKIKPLFFFLISAWIKWHLKQHKISSKLLSLRGLERYDAERFSPADHQHYFTKQPSRQLQIN